MQNWSSHPPEKHFNDSDCTDGDHGAQDQPRNSARIALGVARDPDGSTTEDQHGRVGELLRGRLAECD